MDKIIKKLLDRLPYRAIKKISQLNNKLYSTYHNNIYEPIKIECLKRTLKEMKARWNKINPIVLWYYKAIKDLEDIDNYSKEGKEGLMANFIYAKSTYESLVNDVSEQLENITEEF